MEDKVYNILWIDDEHESLKGAKMRAKRNGIHLLPYKSLNGGISELERNYSIYDGVLLDAKFFENEDDIQGTEDTYNIHRAKERLLQLPKKFDLFVLTGQAEAYQDNTFKKAFKDVYKKGSDQDIERLFIDMKAAADKQEDTQLRHEHKRVFDVCSDRYLGDHAEQIIINLLKVDNDPNIENQFNGIRKIMEDLFLSFKKFNLLPDEFINPIALNESSKFLSGKDYNGELHIIKGYIHYEETHLPRQIAYYLKSILAVTQAGSHRTHIDNHVRYVSTPYLFKSVLYQLLDVLVWFKLYIDSNPQTGNWEKVEKEQDAHSTPSTENIKGTVIFIHDHKGYGFFKSDVNTEKVIIPPNLVGNHGLYEGMAIRVEIEEYTYHKTGEIKNRVKTIHPMDVTD